MESRSQPKPAQPEPEPSDSESERPTVEEIPARTEPWEQRPYAESDGSRSESSEPESSESEQSEPEDVTIVEIEPRSERELPTQQVRVSKDELRQSTTPQGQSTRKSTGWSLFGGSRSVEKGKGSASKKSEPMLVRKKAKPSGKAQKPAPKKTSESGSKSRPMTQPQPRPQTEPQPERVEFRSPKTEPESVRVEFRSPRPRYRAEPEPRYWAEPQPESRHRPQPEPEPRYRPEPDSRYRPEPQREEFRRPQATRPQDRRDSTHSEELSNHHFRGSDGVHQTMARFSNQDIKRRLDPYRRLGHVQFYVQWERRRGDGRLVGKVYALPAELTGLQRVLYAGRGPAPSLETDARRMADYLPMERARSLLMVESGGQRARAEHLADRFGLETVAYALGEVAATSLALRTLYEGPGPFIHLRESSSGEPMPLLLAHHHGGGPARLFPGELVAEFDQRHYPHPDDWNTGRGEAR